MTKWPWRSRSMTSIFNTNESIPGCMFAAHLVILAQICDELSRGKAKFPRILSQKGQNDLEGHGQWPLFSIPTKSIIWCMRGANLVVLTQMCDELSCGQGKVYGQTDQRTVGQTQTTTIPLRSERPRGNKTFFIQATALKTLSAKRLPFWSGMNRSMLAHGPQACHLPVILICSGCCGTVPGSR